MTSVVLYPPTVQRCRDALAELKAATEALLRRYDVGINASLVICALAAFPRSTLIELQGKTGIDISDLRRTRDALMHSKIVEQISAGGGKPLHDLTDAGRALHKSMFESDS